MESAVFSCPASWRGYLPHGVRGLDHPRDLAGRNWEALALTRRGRDSLGAVLPSCRILLAPGDSLPEIPAETVITYGLSPRDSLTLSSLRSPVLCVQRLLPRPDGALVEPQEFPLPPLPAPAEELLPLLGIKLLYLPLDTGTLLW
ncbi:MAG: hypothetical protein HFG08_00015 [Oscillibacter sp.]|nr:hypothetical protein [Oscillibacter sp.]